VQVDRERMWVARARAGDDQAFARLVEAYQGPVYNLAYRMLGSPTEAEDAAQETFLRVYTRLDSYDPTRKFSSWILSIASHHCVDLLRRRRGNTVSMEEIMSWRWIPDERPRPEERALSGEQARVIHRLLERLPPQYRLAIVLRYWYDLSYEEMAEISQTTVSAIKSRLHRARQMMANLLADTEPAREADQAPERSVPNHALPGSI
jgi:RNA polymerase sigma-70 factor, ECF subfamily